MFKFLLQYLYKNSIIYPISFLERNVIMKKVLFASLITILAMLLCVNIFAAETNVDVGEGQAITSLDDAIAALDGNGGTITVHGTVAVLNSLTIPEQSGNLTIIAADGGELNFASGVELTFAKNTNANTITLNLPVTTVTSGLPIFGGFNSIVFGKNFEVTGTIKFFGGVDAATGASVSTITDAEVNEANNLIAITTLPYSITVENGNFAIFTAGNLRRARECIYGSIAAKLEVTINGGTFGTHVSYSANDPLKTDRAISLSGMSILADDATLTINGGTFNSPIYASAFTGTHYTTASACSQVTNSSKDYYATDGNITITINGGKFTNDCIEISAAQTAASLNRLLRGNYTLTIGENAELADGIVLDATQVKAYEGENKAATLSYTNSATVVAKNFDTATGCENTVAEPTRIACIGDSLTQGTGSSNFNKYSYPAQLYTKLAEEGEYVIVSNYGCGGTKVTDFQGMYYRDGLAYTLSVNETDPDIVLLCLGVNDRGIVGNTVGPRDLFRKEYASLLTSYTDLESTEEVYAITPPYVYEYGVEVGQIVRYLQKTTAQDLIDNGNTELTVIDMYQFVWKQGLNGQKNGEMLGSDGLHPHDTGYGIMMNAIYNGAFAEEKLLTNPMTPRSDIYIDQANGTTDGAGTADDPIKHLTVAYEMADRNADVVTIHFVGTYTDDNINYKAENYTGTPSNNTPMDLKKIRYVGETDANGNAGKWLMSSKYFLINCDTEFDNITVKYNGNSALYYFGGFNNVKFGEGFNTESRRYAIFCAGHNVYADKDENSVSDVRFTTAESVSSDKDITVEILGGKFLFVIAGNRHYGTATQALYGTYSGDMTFTVGEKAFISNDIDQENAICGMNYLTGSINATINSWGKGVPIREYSAITKKSALAEYYDETKNTGKVTITCGENVDNAIIRSGDLNADGQISIADTITLLKYIVNGLPEEYDSRYFYDRTSVNLIHVVRSLKIAVR